ncbi:MAG: tripartite tricarboxylate transporter substrate binding protein [Pseudomonadota bacterium]
MQRTGAIFFAAMLLASAPHAWAQSTYPNRTIHIVVPSAAGGTTDIVARAVAQVLTQPLGVSVIVEQRVGGNTNIGSASVARAAPDGYTLLVNTDTLTSNASVYRDAGYDPVTSFSPVTMLTRAPGALAVRKDLGAATIDDFVALAKAKGRNLTVASTGTGTVSHLTGLMFRQRMGLPAWTDVPYQGAAKAVTDLLGGHVDAIFSTVVPLVPHADEGHLKLLAVTSKVRSKAAPNVPTVAERTALKDFDVTNWLALLAPAGTPQPIVDKLAAATAAALKDPEVVRKFALLGMEAAGEGPQPLAETLRASTAQWREVVREAGLKLN